MGKRSPKIKLVPRVLANIRESTGYTEDELAKKLRVSVEKVRRVERGEDDYTAKQIIRFADVCQISLAAFFSDDFKVPSFFHITITA